MNTTPADAAVEMIRRICPAHLDRDVYGRLLAEHFAAHRAAVLREAADAIDATYTGFGIDKYVRHGADLLRRMADEAQQAAPTVTEEPEEPESAGPRQCGHDDYHDAHEWADLPHVWCPGYSLTEEPGR